MVTGIENGELTVSRFRFGENFGVGMTDVVGLQLFGKNRLAALEMLPTQPGNRRAVRVVDQLDFGSSSPSHLSQRGIGRDYGFALCDGNKLFLTQQTFAVHAHLGPEFVVAEIDVA